MFITFFRKRALVLCQIHDKCLVGLLDPHDRVHRALSAVAEGGSGSIWEQERELVSVLSNHSNDRSSINQWTIKTMGSYVLFSAVVLVS
jgi:hypothetical protein